ncbi:MAG: LuxR C-terminal-related transcriptional regulator [Candidatus Moduliflexus flocculans]|nr:LuxR C-terminal-related transcriptional regulator [Candidatus Moduliflexus flocculans]
MKDYVLTLLVRVWGKVGRGSRNQPLVEAMSERELEILRLLAEGLSNREIAERLVIAGRDSQIPRPSHSRKNGNKERMRAAGKGEELGLV